MAGAIIALPAAIADWCMRCSFVCVRILAAGSASCLECAETIAQRRRYGEGNMGDVIEFRSGTKAEGPHLQGKCRCLACGHEWQGVSPVGTVDGLECPSCHLQKGTHVGLAVPEYGWHCHCGNSLFYVSTDGYLCVYCGTWQRFGEPPRRA